MWKKTNFLQGLARILRTHTPQQLRNELTMLGGNSECFWSQAQYIEEILKILKQNDQLRNKKMQ